jgi:hypothetical protein
VKGVMRRIHGPLGALLAAGSLAAGGIAGAQEPQFTVSVDERSGDVRGPLDVVRVALGPTGEGRLRAEITTAQPWDTEDLRAASGAGSVCLRLFTRRSPDAEPPDYLVCATPAATGDGLVGRVLRDRANGLPRTVAEATITRPTTRSIFLRFPTRAVGNPARVRFAAETVTRGSGCGSLRGCVDAAPDAPSTARLRLRG